MYVVFPVLNNTNLIQLMRFNEVLLCSSGYFTSLGKVHVWRKVTGSPHLQPCGQFALGTVWAVTDFVVYTGFELWFILIWKGESYIPGNDFSSIETDISKATQGFSKNWISPSTYFPIQSSSLCFRCFSCKWEFNFL